MHMHNVIINSSGTAPILENKYEYLQGLDLETHFLLFFVQKYHGYWRDLENLVSGNIWENIWDNL